MKRVYVVLYDNFEALDVFGPVEALGITDEYKIHFVSLDGGIIENDQSIKIVTEPMKSIQNNEILLIPGGFGSRKIINDERFINALTEAAVNAEYVLCVCTGSALAAKTGILDGKNATSNKNAFDWVVNQGLKVKWNREARWVVDKNIYTSAGVSAGMDMAVGFIRDRFGEEKALTVCREMEYHWNDDWEHDTF